MPYGSSGLLLPSSFSTYDYSQPIYGQFTLNASSRNWGPYTDPVSGLTNVTGIDSNWELNSTNYGAGFGNRIVAGGAHYISPPAGGNTNVFANGYSSSLSLLQVYADINLYFGSNLIKTTTDFLSGPVVITSGEWSPYIGQPIIYKIQYYHFGWITSCFDFNENQANEKTNDTSFPLLTLPSSYGSIVEGSPTTIYDNIRVNTPFSLGTVSTTDVLTQFNAGQSCYGTATGSLNSLQMSYMTLSIQLNFT